MARYFIRGFGLELAKTAAPALNTIMRKVAEMQTSLGPKGQGGGVGPSTPPPGAPARNPHGNLERPPAQARTPRAQPPRTTMPRGLPPVKPSVTPQPEPKAAKLPQDLD